MYAIRSYYGSGRIGRVHAQSITYHVANAEVKAMSDVRLEGVKEFAESLGIKEVYNDYKQILNDPEIDAVLVCSSTNTHSQISIEAMKAGKHVFCEKPIDGLTAPSPSTCSFLLRT